MAKKRIPGLYKREGIWIIDKIICGNRLCESTGTGDLDEAEKYLARRIEGIRQAVIYGVRSLHSFQEAILKYLQEKQHKRSIGDDALHLKTLNQYIGHLTLDQIHNGTLQPFIQARLAKGVKMKTINLALGVLRHLLNLAASEWYDDQGMTWLQAPPKIKLLTIKDARGAYPLSWEEQDRLFNALPAHLQAMALYKVNTGSRQQEVCRLRWEWEVAIPELETSVFLIPKHIVKNKDDRLVVLNHVAKAVIDQQRGKHPEYVFTYRGKPVTLMNNSSWQRIRETVGLKQVRVHDLKHTFGRRLRAAGVSFEDRQDLLGHKSTRMTTHYSSAEVYNLIMAANKVCDRESGGPTLTLLQVKNNWLSEMEKENHLALEALQNKALKARSRKYPAEEGREAKIA